ncbi:MAG: glycosyltransferase [Rhodospirillaceae bacterium]
MDVSRVKALEHIEDFARGFSVPECAHDAGLAKDVTVLIKTFERPMCIAWGVTSLKKYYPSLTVLVCDDSRDPLFGDRSEPLPGVHWLCKPFEDGHMVGAGRNFLVDRVKTDFFFLTDDDVQFTSKSDLKSMLDFLQEYDFDMVGGTQSPWDYGTATFAVDNGELIEKHYDYRGIVAPGFVACDRLSVAFLARHGTVSRVRWEENVGRNEHADFFYRASRQGLKIAQMGRFCMTHKRRCEVCESLSDWLRGLWSGHASKQYRISMYGGGESEEEALEAHRKLYQKHILEKNGITGIRDDKSLFRLIKLFFVIGHPVFNLKPGIPAVQRNVSSRA